MWHSVLWSGYQGGDWSKVGLDPVGLFQPGDSVTISVPHSFTMSSQFFTRWQPVLAAPKYQRFQRYLED